MKKIQSKQEKGQKLSEKNKLVLPEVQNMFL